MATEEFNKNSFLRRMEMLKKIFSRPESWDVVGILSWIFFIYCGVNLILGFYPQWLGYTMIIIALGGLSVDMGIVIKKFILRRRNVNNK